MSATGTSIDDLHALIEQDRQESIALQGRIDQLTQFVADKKLAERGTSDPDIIARYELNKPNLSIRALGSMETEGKKVLKDILKRLDELDDKPDKDATDRTMAQLLNARQVIVDRQVQQMGEITSLTHEAMGGRFSSKGEPVLVEAERELGRYEKARILKKKQKSQAVAEEAQASPSTPLAMPAPDAREPIPLPRPAPVSAPASAAAPASEPHVLQGPSLDSVAEPVDPRDVRAAAYATEEGGDWQHVSAEGKDEYDDEDEDDDEDEEEQMPPVDKSAWPICYQILDIDPRTDSRDFVAFKNLCDGAKKRLALQHAPQRRPNDPDAAVRWPAVEKAYNTLSNPERKTYYDNFGREPAIFQDVDLSKLSLE